MSNITNWEDWIQWKKTCAFERCDEGVRNRFARFGWVRYAQTACRSPGLEEEFTRDQTGDPGSLAWHWVDSHVIRKSTLNHRPYKEALFEQCPEFQELKAHIHGDVFREAAKEFRRYYTKRGRPMTHLTPPRRSGRDEALGDLLDGMDQNLVQEIEELIMNVREEALSVFEELDEITKTAFVASSMSISLAHPVITGLTGRSNTTLYDRVDDASQSVVNPACRKKDCSRQLQHS